MTPNRQARMQHRLNPAALDKFTTVRSGGDLGFLP
jgi:hypothetical protein